MKAEVILLLKVEFIVYSVSVSGMIDIYFILAITVSCILLVKIPYLQKMLQMSK